MLTSPPYFDLEVYSHEDSQSTSRFKTWETWCAGFLEPVLANCLRCLAPNGISAWSVKNFRKCPLQTKVFELHAKYGFAHVQTVGMMSTARNQGKAAKMNEETFLFKRTTCWCHDCGDKDEAFVPTMRDGNAICPDCA